MFEFVLKITSARRLAGINAARAAYNQALVLAFNQPLEDHPDYKASNKAYLQFVINSAADSYANQFNIED